MEHSLTTAFAGSLSRRRGLNPYSNGTLSDTLSESTLRFSVFPIHTQLSPNNQRVNPFRTLFSQMYAFETYIPNKKETFSAYYIHFQ